MQQPELDIDDDFDFTDLDTIISEAEVKRASTKALSSKQRRLNAGVSDEERTRLLAEIRRHEDAYVWQTVAAVALFHSQHCAGCSHDHRFFMGWMTLQQHRNDPNCRRYTRGKPVEHLPERIEYHGQGDVQLCYDCAESQLIINQFTGGGNAT